jgi:signal transduction histidine kinase/DNA-binding response OmpR family regulator/CHASE3 domain sensor protein
MNCNVAQPQSEVPLARRLFVGAITPILVLLLVGGFLTFQIVRMARSSLAVQHSDQVIGTTYNLQRQIVDQETGVRGFLLTENDDFLTPYRRARPAAVLSELKRLVATDPVLSAELAKIERQYKDWSELAAIAASGSDMSTARSLTAMRNRRLQMNALRAAIDDILALEAKSRDLRIAEAQTTSTITLWGILPLMILAAAALGLIARRQIGTVAETYSAALSNEQASKKAVEAQNWLRSQQLALSEQLQGELSLSELATRALDALTPAVGAEVAAYYVAEPGVLQRIAAFALDNGSQERFKHGEGLVGQAALSGGALHIRQVPPEFLKVRSGTGAADCVEVVLVPTRFEGVTMGVLEFGFLNAVDQRALDLLERAAETMAIAVNSVHKKLRLRELLEESQRQAEELQTQQEELRVTNEELQQQSDALRTAHAQLEERQEELEVSNADLAKQRDALEEMQHAMREKAEELARASRYKSEFLANMSHELRTPLNSSIILAKLLADNKSQNLTEKQVQFATTIYSAGNDLLALINDILDISKIEAGRLEANIATSTLQGIVEPVVRMFEPVAEQRQIAFSVRVDQERATLDTDAQRVQQILKNLLSNAFKFIEHGSVTLEVRSLASEVHFSVSDTGPGIPENKQELIFEAFRQADGSTNRKYGGTGLGLSISRDLARLLDGDLKVTSQAERGSTFTLSLPWKPLDKTRQHSLAAANTPLPPLKRAVDSERPHRARGNSSAIRSVRPPAVKDDRTRIDRKQPLLLIVEDDLPFAEILGEMAHNSGFQFVVAHTADDALRLATDLIPNAVLLDVKLPDHSGLSVLDRLKHTGSTRHIPVHVISSDDYSQAARSMGAVGYLKKPVSPDELSAMLKTLTDRFTRLRRLLIVEDDATQRDAIEQLLSSADVEIVAVDSVSAALEQLAAKTFDCIVTDLALDDGTGYDLLEKMAGNDAYSFPPVIVYTGRSLTADEEQRLLKYSNSIIVKGARSPERLLDEVTLFLHQVESELPPDWQRMLHQARDREATFDGRKILIAEDDVRNIFAVSSILEPKGAELVIARNGREALEVLEQRNDISLVLMDIMMPEMDGLQAMQAIRATGRWPKLPIIALTAKVMADDQERCLRAGANDYIAKPLDVEMLLSLMRVWMPR